MHAPQKLYMSHAPAATPPKLVADQHSTPSEKPCTPAKPATANTQCNQSAVQSSTEPKVPVPVCQLPRFLLALLVIPQ